MSKKKIFRRALRVIFCLIAAWALYSGWRVNTFDRTNLGKVAIAFDKDTCIILSEQIGHFINSEPLTEIRYKDKIGVWHEERVATSFIKKLE